MGVLASVVAEEAGKGVRKMRGLPEQPLPSAVKAEVGEGVSKAKVPAKESELRKIMRTVLLIRGDSRDKKMAAFGVVMMTTAFFMNQYLDKRMNHQKRLYYDYEDWARQKKLDEVQKHKKYERAGEPLRTPTTEST
eukprot:TRINITY_DN9478_c0_g1_i1.p1 TRINITY_DN9478_c0_g1~~TRINITY_DN9478_c0_g1_i1.p1  ORF type:complete len:144 (+),score=38.55 TRINITY_DN9478_c0_g1_i1:27-434(+)